MHKVAFYLDRSSLFQFELVSKLCQKFTANVWKNKKIEALSGVQFETTQKESNPDKWDYFIIEALFRYIVIEKNPLTTTLPHVQEQARKIISNYSFLTDRFPILNAYINHDIKHLGHAETSIEPEVVKNFNATVIEGKYSGELLLQGLLLTRGPMKERDDVKKIKKCFRQAIQKGATCAGVLAISLNLNIGMNAFGQLFFNSAIALEAAKQKDERALYLIFNKLPGIGIANRFYNDGHRFHSLLIFLANISLLGNDQNNAEQFIGEALLLPQEQITALRDEQFLRALENVAKYKAELCKWEDADRLYEQLLFAYGSVLTPSAKLLDQINIVKCQLKRIFFMGP